MNRKSFFTLPLLLLVMLIAAGCTKVVRHDVSADFARLTPYTVAVLPVEWSPEAGTPNRDVGRLFRETEAGKLAGKFYRPSQAKGIDEALTKLGERFLKEKKPAEVATALGVDAVLYTKITRWSSDVVVNYAYIDVEASFTLYHKSGTKLWGAKHGVKDSDIRLDKVSLELAIIKAYEPRVQRLVDIVFQTLPDGTPPGQRRQFFDWLP